jgi:hypothetical protein
MLGVKYILAVNPDIPRGSKMTFLKATAQSGSVVSNEVGDAAFAISQYGKFLQ